MGKKGKKAVPILYKGPDYDIIFAGGLNSAELARICENDHLGK